MRRFAGGFRVQVGLWLAGALVAGAAAPMASADGPGQEATSSGAAREPDDEIVVTGTRVPKRTRLESLAPVDVLSESALQNQATTELPEALATLVPSLDFPRPAITDGTDHVRPATLRGLAPDQTLVLVNSKRRHASALVNVNGSVGRGSAAVDLDAIPLAALESVEVLRDGASAQYGSDAIAGVLNLRLRERREGGEASVTYGNYLTRVATERGRRSEHDGATATYSSWVGLPLGVEGFLTLSGEYRRRNPTSRGDFDSRLLALPVPERLRVTSRYGDSGVDEGTLYANAGLPLGGDWEVYGWFGLQQRDGESAATPRLADNPNNVLDLYPHGFLPKIATDIHDLTAATGVRGPLGGWRADLSAVYGRNRIEYRTEDSVNATFGADSRTDFDSGRLAYSQLTGNLNLARELDWGLAGPVTLAFGTEARHESYSIGAGEPGSYAAGPVTGPGIVPGAQGFPGFTPDNELREGRNAVGAYAETEAPLFAKFRASAAVRAEHYSDFGSATTAKLSGRYDFSEQLALRATASTGFRAPSLQQEFFTSTATNFINGEPREIATLPSGSSAARALGSRELDAERSHNYSAGLVLRLGPVEATLDAYRIEIDDRIVLSENLLDTRADIAALLAPLGVNGARFFINGVDTRTSGLDLLVRTRLATQAAGEFELALSGNLNHTVVRKVPTTGVLAQLNPPPSLFDRVNRLTFEDGTPQDKLGVSVDWNLPGALAGWSLSLRGTRYGDVTEPGLPANATEPRSLRDQNLDARWLFDLELRASFLGDRLGLAVGADNLFDRYPPRAPIARINPSGSPVNLNGTNALAFSRYSPFGFGGRFLYARASYRW